jgi:hypothetical protein
MAYNVYQYVDPSAKGDDTRWIAAPDLASANAAAARRGWHSCGGLIYRSDQVPQDCVGLTNAGVDVITAS